MQVRCRTGAMNQRSAAATREWRTLYADPRVRRAHREPPDGAARSPPSEGGGGLSRLLAEQASDQGGTALLRQFDLRGFSVFNELVSEPERPGVSHDERGAGESPALVCRWIAFGCLLTRSWCENSGPSALALPRCVAVWVEVALTEAAARTSPMPRRQYSDLTRDSSYRRWSLWML